jgi:hypothetical protein
MIAAIEEENGGYGCSQLELFEVPKPDSVEIKPRLLIEMNLPWRPAEHTGRTERWQDKDGEVKLVCVFETSPIYPPD